MRPRRGGASDFPVAPAIVLSHDCEFTKVGKWGIQYPLIVAPLRRLAQFDGGQGELGNIRGNRVRFLFHLPPGGLELDDEYTADLTLMQPLTAAELIDARHNYVTSIGEDLKTALQYVLVRFFSDRGLTQ